MTLTNFVCRCLRWLLLVLLSQWVSGLQTSTGVFSVLLDGIHIGFHFPIFQNALLYAFLIVVYLPLFLLLLCCCRCRLNLPIFVYAFIGLFDVLGNVFAVAAYRFVPLTSVLLMIQASVTPVIILLSVIFLRRSFRFLNYVGCGFCVVGSTILVLSDVSNGSELFGSTILRTLLGDLLSLLSAISYGICNVCEEFAFQRRPKEDDCLLSGNGTNDSESSTTTNKKCDSWRFCVQNTVEYLAFVGLFGLTVNLFLVSVVGEVKELGYALWHRGSEAMGYLMGYTGAAFLYYVFVPLLISSSSATFFSVACLTSNALAVVARMVLRMDRVILGPLYFVALGVVVLGICVYAAGGESAAHDSNSAEISGEDVVVEGLEEDDGTINWN